MAVGNCCRRLTMALSFVTSLISTYATTYSPPTTVDTLSYSTIISTASKSYPESIITAVDGYFLSNTFQDNPGAGQIVKYSFDGVLNTAWGPITHLSYPFGLALSSDGTNLYSAQAGAVKKYHILPDGQYQTGHGFALLQTFETLKSVQISHPNGLCMDASESELYVTDPGFFQSYGGQPGGLAKIDLATGVVTKLFSVSQGRLGPNGCTVQSPSWSASNSGSGMVWMVNVDSGISSFDIATNSGPVQQTWSQIIATQNPPFGGGGIVQYEGVTYVGLNGNPDTYGQIWACHAASGVWSCTQVVGNDFPPCADMQLDVVSSFAPTLLCPGFNKDVVTRLGLHSLASRVWIHDMSVAQWTGSAKVAYNAGYGKALGIYSTTNGGSYEAGCAVISSASAAERRKDAVISVIFKASVSTSLSQATSRNLQLLTPSVLVTATTEVISTLGLQSTVTVPAVLYITEPNGVYYAFSSSGLTAGAITGIVFAAVAIVLIIAGIVYKYAYRGLEGYDIPEKGYGDKEVVEVNVEASSPRETNKITDESLGTHLEATAKENERLKEELAIAKVQIAQRDAARVNRLVKADIETQETGEAKETDEAKEQEQQHQEDRAPAEEKIATEGLELDEDVSDPEHNRDLLVWREDAVTAQYSPKGAHAVMTV